MDKQRMNHPRPQMIRTEWESFDGEWKFKFDDESLGIENSWYEGLNTNQNIMVPFTYETKLSGVTEESFHPVVWYQKEFSIDKITNYLLHFEGSDYKTDVWLNGHYIGQNLGGYHRFSFELSSKLQNKNKLVVRVEDSMDPSQPRGKQRWLKDNFGCWYVQTTGIWKSVWLEKVEANYIEYIKLTPDVENKKLSTEVTVNTFYMDTAMEVIAEVSFEGRLISKSRQTLSKKLNKLELSVEHIEDSAWGMRKWSPDTPYLYDLQLTLLVDNEKVDEISSYFGMRSIDISGETILLNGHNLYQRLILDQGYWEESGITPPSVEALEIDVLKIKEMGYNGLRKHQKIEDERFLYLCDKHGLLVWSEMAAGYEFNDRAVEMLTKEWLEIVKQQYNHPSIIVWVPFNESWGVQDIYSDKKQQTYTESIYYLTKTLDSMRPVVSNDGWVHTVSDIITLHDYEELGAVFTQRYQNKDQLVNNEKMFNNDWFAFADGYEYKGQPIIISEFGGIAFNHESGWGYGNQVTDQKSFMKRFDKIHEAIQELPYISGYCYTQLTDVEQEVNGLLLPNRESKVDIGKIREINERRTK